MVYQNGAFRDFAK